MNCYSKILKQNLPKLWNLYNFDSFSDTYGLGDRNYWAWKTIDFANGTFQGGTHALAIASQLGITADSNFTNKRIVDVILASKSIIQKNGSVGEAYPQENSFCVTSLLAFDLLSAIKVLNENNVITQEVKSELLSVVCPLINFISKNDEEHAIISNHIATGVAAITLWNKLSGEKNDRNETLLNFIFDHQSNEGWYKEYEGADPGYQTLCTYYLASTYRVTNDSRLKESLVNSGKFLFDLLHPDYSIGGLYGSRNTEVYYPGGIVDLANVSDEFYTMSQHFAKGIELGKHLNPLYIDANNYIPLINSYAYAAYHDKDEHDKKAVKPLYESKSEKIYLDAGLHLKSNKSYFAITNFKKGGVIKAFDQKKKELVVEDGGLFGKLKNGTKFSTQQYDQNQTFKNKSIESLFYKINDSYPTPFQFIVLRLFSLTVFKSTILGNVFKRAIVNMLMTGKNKLAGKVVLRYDFNDTYIKISENITKPKNTDFLEHIGKAKAIHMASSGYNIGSQKKENEQNIVKWV